MNQEFDATYNTLCPRDIHNIVVFCTDIEEPVTAVVGVTGTPCKVIIHIRVRFAKLLFIYWYALQSYYSYTGRIGRVRLSSNQRFSRQLSN